MRIKRVYHPIWGVITAIALLGSMMTMAGAAALMALIIVVFVERGLYSTLMSLIPKHIKRCIMLIILNI